MKIKIAQISDSHIGAKLSYLGDRSKYHREQIKKAFAKGINLFISERADVVVMAGDIFNDPFPSSANVDFVATQIEKLINNKIFVLLLAGNHDRNEKGSVFDSSRITAINSKYFLLANKQKQIKWEINELSLAVHAFGIERQKDSGHPYNIQEMERDARFTFNIGVFHGSVDLMGRIPDNYPILLQDVYNAKFDYVALGDWHNLLDVSKDLSTQVWYSGAPELIDSDQDKSGNVLIVELEEGKNPNVRSVQVGEINVLNLSLEIDGKANIDNLIAQIKKYANKNIVLNILIKGFKSLDSFDFVSVVELSIVDDFYHVNIKDETVLKISDQELAKYPENMLIGRFIKNMNELRNEKGIDQTLIDEAIQTGVYLLKGGKL